MSGNLLESTILLGDLIEEILVRVPASSLVKFKIVCKSWNALISSSKFAKKQLHRSTSDPTRIRPRLACLGSDISRRDKIRFYSVQSFFKNPSASAFTEDTCFQTDDELEIFGSCNGLLCIGLLKGKFRCRATRRCKSIRLWNPCTGSVSDWLKIVQEGCVHGFGYDHVHDKYKFLDCYWEHGHKVHTFGSNSCTTINQDLPFEQPWEWTGKFVNGTLNWAARPQGNLSKWKIISFDLANENFCQMSLPNRNDSDDHFFPVLGVWRDSLSVCFNENKSRLVLWVMKKYGVQESWTKLVTISSEDKVYTISCARFCPDLAVSFCPRSPDSISSFKLVMLRANSFKLTQWIYYIGPGDRHVYHESLVSPCHLGLPSFLYGSTIH
ncbi:hypothetical protein HN51_056328 [Arachis hypogaea]|uniref:F-box protein n=1 Tax=Arachis hypogaea TaxID=3818 RepID=A0A444XTN7_ARAHY|nr:F-box/kelch-repeat protein At3g23880-like [Arachis ipaensis]XP_025677136.1 F-box/kelch-repeat protein At3g23880 [Arachis hypogaea]QHN79174.1 F-box protein [Arachis hypogaea]RYQ93082.1 hypothetical protein Ahy_B09g099341 [Arachis hypogaea]